MTDAFLTGVYAAVTVVAFCAVVGAAFSVWTLVTKAVARLFRMDD